MKRIGLATAVNVLNALDPGHARTPFCTPVLPVVGG
jgi:hypothetical protein